MKFQIAFLFAFCCLSFSTRCQITKGNWMVGGNVDFSRISNTSTASAYQNYTLFNASLSPGYFLIDKFAAGLRGAFEYGYYNTGSGGSSSSRIDIGPFVRYYFLSTEGRVNIFSEASYLYQLSRVSGESFGGTHGYKISAGPVVYLNNVVGIEFTIGYSSQRVGSSDGNLNTFRTGIGLQIHLQRDEK